MAHKRKIFAFVLISVFGLLIILHQQTLTKRQLLKIASRTPVFERTFPKLTNNVPCDPENNSCATLVTAYFTFNKSKFNHTQYKDWFQNFLKQVENPIIIFTQPFLQPMMVKLRKRKPTHFILYDEIWDLPWLNEPKFLYEYYHKMHDIDPEKHLHSPELYAVWNSKPWMLQTASMLNPFDSTYFFWMDIGSVRTVSKLKGFPSIATAIQVFGQDGRSENFHKMIVFAIKKFENYKSPPESNTFEEMRMDFVIGGFFGGTGLSVDWFSKTFYALHDSKLKEGVFVGKDQTLYNWIAIQRPDKILVVCSCLQTPWECGDHWFYFQTWYGTEDSNLTCASAPVRSMTGFLTEYMNK